ncbi:MAG: hypothetical protein KKA45_02615, partial [Alphaproteobacteria bacterium]|nr:hypothetical protein [Alphaproteobacteria bacterium]
MTLGSVVLSDHLTLGLENRAFREGLVGEDHFTLSEFASPKIMSASVAEEQVADMICLYDEVWSEERRFHLNTLNRVAGATLVRPRPSLIRALNFHFDHPALSRQEWADKLSGRTEFELLREQAAAEAHLLMRRDIDWYLADAMA